MPLLYAIITVIVCWGMVYIWLSWKQRAAFYNVYEDGSKSVLMEKSTAIELARVFNGTVYKANGTKLDA